MSQQKRKAAADIFKEQNQEKFADFEAEFGASAPPPAPMQQAAQTNMIAPQGIARASAPAPSAARYRAPVPPSRPPQSGLKTSEELQLEKEPIRVRETGLWFWKRVIVPPNAYVVHTRIGKKTPITLGLGQSFRYNPDTDAYLVVPAAMQTIGIVANGISKEKQGINILAYVQWQIADFGIAYRKLDFSDSRDPLGIVNAQLREQAEAALKDKIATMSVEEVLTDKQPIIEELTTRLKSVAEGRQDSENDGEGLGIKIVTVQIKEAYISSQALWENLQAPFRYEKEQAARISYLLMQDEIRKKELDNRRFAETGEAETLVEIAHITQTKETEAFELRIREEQARLNREQEALRNSIQIQEQTTVVQRESEQKLLMQKAQVEQETRLAELLRKQQESLERTRLAADEAARRKTLEVEQALRELEEQERLGTAQLNALRQQITRDTERQTLETELKHEAQAHENLLQQRALEGTLNRQQLEQQTVLALQEAANNVALNLETRKVEIDRLRQEIRNLTNERDLYARLIAEMPQIASNMPDVHELKVLQTSSNGDAVFDSLSGFVARMLSMAESLGIKPLAQSNGHTAPDKNAQ
jgi:flotillin